MKLRLIAPPDLDACRGLWPEAQRPHPSSLSFLAESVDRGRLVGALVEARTGAVLAFGLSGFVSDDFLEAHLKKSVSGIARCLIDRARLDDGALLGPNEVAQGNVGPGLNLVVLCYAQTSYDVNDSLARTLMQLGSDAFRRHHEGFRIRSVWQEGNATEEPFLVAGGYLPKLRFADGITLFGFSRSDMDSRWPSHTLSFLFQDLPCLFNFSAAERRILTLALWNLRDEDVARKLAISVDTVHKEWRQIFRRAELHNPAALGVGGNAFGAESTRGPEKRRHLLDYLRKQLHEVRPVPGPGKSV